MVNQVPLLLKLDERLGQAQSITHLGQSFIPASCIVVRAITPSFTFFIELVSNNVGCLKWDKRSHIVKRWRLDSVADLLAVSVLIIFQGAMSEFNLIAEDNSRLNFRSRAHFVQKDINAP